MSVLESIKRRSFIVLLGLVLSLSSIAAGPARLFPDSIPLPDGFRPEGIAAGPGNTFFVGSIPTGAIYRGDLRTGKGAILVPAQEGRAAIGLKYDDRTGFLFVAGGPTGYAYVYDTATGENVAAIQLTTLQPTFINDVVITRDAAYFTNSSQPELYRVPLRRNGLLREDPRADVITLGGDFQLIPDAFNTNGIAATPDGKTLIIVNSTEGALYNVNPRNGVADRIELRRGDVQFGDGILLNGKTLYVVQNRLNQIAVVELNPGFTAGDTVNTLSSDLFRVPTTIARFGDALYVVNARFDTTPTPTTDYDVVRVRRRG